jgi:hypothetical protein
VNRASFALLASFVVALALGKSPEPTKVRITTWNLEWFPSGSAHGATPLRPQIHSQALLMLVAAHSGDLSLP